ncbi:MAG: hypothetical protein J6P37_08170 [Lachnospiraceae bacterium]|jgi:hypothetical protein|nr:hypothetical protein [Lachnospiraceae bacterium]
MEYKKICKRCLISEMGEEAYREMIKKHTDIIKDEDKSDEATYKARLNVCKECEKLNAGTCASCGCYVEIRAALKRNACPNKKW